MANNPLGSGDGSRTTTDGGVDNIGAGEKFSTRTTAAGDPVSGPAPTAGMSAKRKDVENSKKDDSSPFGLKPDLTPETNREPNSAP